MASGDGSLRRALGPPKGPSPLELSAGVWTTVNQRVHFVLNAKMRGGPYGPFRSLPSFEAMFAACVEWRERMFPALVAVSREVERYARETVGRQYPLLEAALARKDARQAAAIVEQLALDAGVVVALASGLTPMVAEFRRANEAFDSELQKRPESSWMMLVPKPKSVDAAVDLLRGTWDTLAHYLAEAHALILDGSAMGDLRPEDVRAALAEWEFTAGDASSFIRTAEGQQRMLDGLFIAPIVFILAGTSRDGTIVLQSFRDIGVRPGDRLIVFGVGAVDGRRELVEVKPPGPGPALWSYAVKSTERPRGGPWMTIDNIRWLRTPLLSSPAQGLFYSLATAEACEAAGERTIVRVGEEMPLEVGTRITVIKPNSSSSLSGKVVERQQITNPAGDRFWNCAVDAKLPAGGNLNAIWAGMYRDDG